MIYLAVALILLWLLVGGYLVLLFVRQRSLDKELRVLHEVLREKNSGN